MLYVYMCIMYICIVTAVSITVRAIEIMCNLMLFSPEPIHLLE